MRLRNLLTVTQQGAGLPMALGSNRISEPRFSSGKGATQRGAQWQTIWVLLWTLASPGLFQYWGTELDDLCSLFWHLQICLKSGGWLASPSIWVSFIKVLQPPHGFLIEHRVWEAWGEASCLCRSYYICWGRWGQGNRQEFNYSRDTQGLLLSMALPGFLPAWPSTQTVKSLKLAAAIGQRRFLTPCATFLFSKTLPSSQTGSPLSRQNPFSHENFPHARGGPAFPRVWPWSPDGEQKETTQGLGCPLQLLWGPRHPFLKRGPAQALRLMGGSSFRASPSCFMCGSLTPSTSQARGNASQQLHSQQEGPLSLLNPAPNMKTLVTWKQPPKSLVIPKEEVLFLSSAWKPWPKSTCGQISCNATHLSRFSSEVTLERPCSRKPKRPKEKFWREWSSTRQSLPARG